MSNVISMARFLNEKRANVNAAAEAAETQAAKKAAILKAADQAFTLGAMLKQPVDKVMEVAISAAALVSEQFDKEQRERESRYMPAYCDPDNEYRGVKYEATKDLDLAEIAKRVRADIKAAIVSGALPKGLKTSVRISRYSGGQSMTISVKGLPEGFKVYQPGYVRATKNFTDYGRRNESWYEGNGATAAYNDMIGKLKAIGDAYNRDNSDIMVDYFDVNFYLHVDLDWKFEDEIRAREAVDLA